MTSYKDFLYRPRTHKTTKDYSFLKPTTKRVPNYPTEHTHNPYISIHSNSTRKEDIFEPVLPYEEPAVLVNLKVFISFKLSHIMQIKVQEKLI
jgi:hypothetical protein